MTNKKKPNHTNKTSSKPSTINITSSSTNSLNNSSQSVLSEDRSTNVSKASNISKSQNTTQSQNSQSRTSSSSSNDVNSILSKSTLSVESKKSIQVVPNNFQSSIKFAPVNEKLKEFLVTIGCYCYELFTEEFDILPEDTLFENLSTPQQLNMLTNFIVNYVCFDVNGSVMTRKFVKKLDKTIGESLVFDKEAYLNDAGDRLNSFITLRFLIAFLRGKLEMEIDMFGYKDSKPIKRGNDITVEDVMRVGTVFSAKERSAVKDVKKKMTKGEQDYAFTDFKDQFNSKHDHNKCFFKIFNSYFEDVPPEKRLCDEPEEVRFHFRKTIVNALKGVVPISKFNESLYRCQEMDVWLTVLEMIFNGFVTTFSSELFFFVETNFDPLEKGWMALVQFVNQNTKLFKKVYKPYMYHRDLNKLQYIFIDNDLFSGKMNEKAANFVGSVTDYNAQVSPKRDSQVYFSICIYLLIMVKNGLNINSRQERLRGFMETFKYHKENKLKFLNIHEPENIKVSNDLKPIVDHLPTCSYCRKTMETALKCSKCNSVFYCSTKCQTSDRPEHKHSCAALCEMMALSSAELKIFVKQK
ncbi:predicted protein [Naegleria gruberi]|uniref:Predicted protein n=1 Tax=Naegleria gruberi TaxID=5762 RepID=D2UZD4_NAEGR|nr:uncharacterized protein NAEGRDRAFT_45448 [Naegleria gruberi]EFC49929.1 predicted protein [Naegleria gruberi]|eukprot:XP_002682673.1 predicted protein [Naegleria gruberi strain NEG-M]